MKKNYLVFLGIVLGVLLTGCGLSKTKKEQPTLIEKEEQSSEYADIAIEEEKGEDNMIDYSTYFKDLKITQSFKKTIEANPVMTQSFGADPYAMEYDDTLYLYMTQDAFEKDVSGEITENTYSKIQSIHVLSTKDMVNFEDHGEIKVAGEGGAAKWAKNSWAPAAAWKMIDGKPKFFLYFADGGGGIGVLQADSPVGPFEDPIGSGMITRNTPTCDKVLWLFDPAVLVDDDGRAYIYFGGGVPEGKAAEPGTGRVAELGDDMISLKGDPVPVYAPYLFEDSGIHKANGKYYYTYCSNFSVDEAGTKKFGFESGQIIMMESDNPMGPFHYKEMILENPAKISGLGGNNHHCVFSFKEQMYITYHTRLLEKNMGVRKGYRSTSIEKIEIAEDGSIGVIPQTLTGCEQLVSVDAYQEQSATLMACQGGIEVVAADEISRKTGAGKMAVSGIDSGDFTVIRGVDFGHKDARTIILKLRRTEQTEEDCVIQVRQDNFKGDAIAYIPVTNEIKEQTFTAVSVSVEKQMNGVHDLYFVFSGKGYEILSWQFVGDESDWYSKAIEKSLVSEGTNGRLEKVLTKLKNGEAVKVAFIGGSVTEGAGAAKVSESYADRIVTELKETYPKADITYVNAGLGGTPSALGVMRYQRDIVEALGTTPDLLFLEFAVNDYEEQTGGRAYEAMVRDILEADEKTAVVLVFAVFQSKWNMQDTYIPVGQLYGLPMVSIKNTTDFAYEQNKITDQEYFSDEFHPTSYGHSIMSDCVGNLLDKVALKEEADISLIPEKAVFGKEFQNEILITAKDTKDAKIEAGGFTNTDDKVHAFFRDGHVSFPENWQCDGTTDAPFEMKLNCKNLLLNYKTSSEKEYGACEVYVDGNLVKELNGYLDTGWNNSNVVLLIDEEESKEHTVSIKMKESGKKFTILCMSYTK